MKTLFGGVIAFVAANALVYVLFLGIQLVAPDSDSILRWSTTAMFLAGEFALGAAIARFASRWAVIKSVGLGLPFAMLFYYVIYWVINKTASVESVLLVLVIGGIAPALGAWLGHIYWRRRQVAAITTERPA